MLRRLTLISVVVILSGCSVLEPAASTTTSFAEIEPDATPTIAPSGGNSTTDSPCLAGDRPFARDGVISAFGGANGDATQISGIRWTTYQGCERVVVDLLTADGAPAGAIDPVGVDYDPELGIIRINLPEDVARSAIADSRFDGDLVSRIYVVATAGGGIAVDLHITRGAAIALRAFEVDSPSRIVIDVRSDDEAEPTIGATSTAQTVLLSPLSGQADTTILVNGYARGTRDELFARIFGDPKQELIAVQEIALGGDSNLWREFSVRMYGLPEQPLQLRVGFGSSATSQQATVNIDTTVNRVPDPPDV